MWVVLVVCIEYVADNVLCRFTGVEQGIPWAQDSTYTRYALKTSSHALRMLTESGDVIRYDFLLSAGFRPFIVYVGGSGEPICSSREYVRFEG